MTAVVIDFATAVALRVERAPRAASASLAFGLAHEHAFWTGTSGIRYVHTVFGLFDCPELPNANIVLARRAANGRAEAIYNGRVEHDAPSLNLADVRHTAATLGATEVHVHFLGAGAEQRALIEADINGASIHGTFAAAG